MGSLKTLGACEISNLKVSREVIPMGSIADVVMVPQTTRERQFIGVLPIPEPEKA